MRGRARWLGMVESSRDECLNAVEFYNRPGSRRPLEAFLVHMHIAWLYLLQAEFEQAGINYSYLVSTKPRRYMKVDGERKSWDLYRSVAERWPDPQHPVRKNLELTIRLRNKIEHRHEHGLVVASAGFCQALVLNYEAEMTEKFGSRMSVASLVHLPVSLSTFNEEGVKTLVAAQLSLPKRLRNFFIDFRSGLGEDVLNDRRFEFRVELVQKRAPSGDADLAVSFVREADLSEGERKAYEALEKTGRVIVRDKFRPVTNLGRFRPSDVCRRVEAAIPFRFSASAEFPQAWKNLKLRPSSTARGDAKKITDERYCFYDEVHRDYVYTQACVDLLIRKCGTEAGFIEVIGRKPRLKATQELLSS
ncbi:DUF3644 domain-containing protein [Mycobacterium intermedium]|uniref:DUF3644 domain-containing protein n=1 Tax=Mycobacterium intermedium TaxID=28445 RepID=UPI000A8FCADF|nr:DUF3644 domain-containing protein [Mycobacterium intermedium]